MDVPHCCIVSKMIAEKIEENVKNQNNKKKKSAKVKVFAKKKNHSQPEAIYIEKLREKYCNVRK